MAVWSDLETELKRWHASGETPTLWWRDDDVRAPSPALDRLLGLVRRHDVPLHLAVVPQAIDPALADRLALDPRVITMQHGLAHVNHEPKGAGASEIGDHRDLELQLRDLRDGWQRLNAAGLPNIIAALAPPWNRISEATVPHLAGLGYRILCTSYPRQSRSPADGLMQVNIHVDPIRWKGGARFRGLERTLDGFCEHLRDRRLGRADRDEPTGMLTHHLQTSDDVWEFVNDLLDRMSRQSVRWVRLSDLSDAV